VSVHRRAIRVRGEVFELGRGTIDLKLSAADRAG
jgi:hypothetical protein